MLQLRPRIIRKVLIQLGHLDMVYGYNMVISIILVVKSERE